MNISFEYPYAFLILVLFFVCQKFCKNKKRAIIFPNITLLQKASAKSIFLHNLIKFLTILFLTIALASPIKENEIIYQNNKGYEISLILDASGSMREYNKFDIVKKIVLDFVDKRRNDRLALSIFADFAYVAVPLTYDKKSIKRLLRQINVGIAGVNRTALYEALFLSTNIFKTSKAKNKIAILLTDGINNVDTIPLEVAIKRAMKYGIKVYTIGIGNRGDYNPFVLKKIAKQTGGEFFEANSVEKLKEVYSTINSLERSEIKSNKFIKKDYYFEYFLVFGAVFMMIYFYLFRHRH